METFSQYIIIDTETTGLYEGSRLVQLGWIVFDKNGNKLSENEYLIKPVNYKIPESAIAIHKITTEQAIERGLLPQEVLSYFMNDIFKPDTLLIGHNIEFDIRVLETELKLLNIFPKNLPISTYCTMHSTKNICKIPSAHRRDFKYPSLTELHRHLFKKGFANAHNALADCRATAECFFELKRLNLIQNSYIHTSIFNKKQSQIIIVEKEYPKKEIKTNQYKFENTNTTTNTSTNTSTNYNWIWWVIVILIYFLLPNTCSNKKDKLSSYSTSTSNPTTPLIIEKQRDSLPPPVEDPIAHAQILINNQDYKSALPIYTKLAYQGNATAQDQLARMYLMGLGVKINLSKAVYWFEKAANQGFDNSQYELGLMYATGKGVIQNYQNAIFYWQQAATQGNENAKKALQVLAEMEQKENEDYRKKQEEQQRLLEERQQAEQQRLLEEKQQAEQQILNRQQEQLRLEKQQENELTAAVQQSQYLLQSTWNRIPNNIQTSLLNEQNNWEAYRNRNCESYRNNNTTKMNCYIQLNQERTQYLQGFIIQ